MAACGSLQHIFENSIQENPSSLTESLSSPWKQIKPLKNPVDQSFTEIFGELHFKENPNPISSSSSSSSLTFPIQKEKRVPVSPFSTNWYPGSYHRRSESFSSMSSESLQLCTEGLGFESLDNMEDMKSEIHVRERVCVKGHSSNWQQYRKGRTLFPPPISCIGRTGKPCVCFQSYREDGRFVLKEMRIPTQEILHACREDGRLRLSLVQLSDQDDDDDIVDDDGEEEGEEEDGKDELSCAETSTSTETGTEVRIENDNSQNLKADLVVESSPCIQQQQQTQLSPTEVGFGKGRRFQVSKQGYLKTTNDYC